MVSNVLLVAPVLFAGGMVFLRSVDELTVDFLFLGELSLVSKLFVIV